MWVHTTHKQIIHKCMRNTTIDAHFLQLILSAIFDDPTRFYMTRGFKIMTYVYTPSPPPGMGGSKSFFLQGWVG